MSSLNVLPSAPSQKIYPEFLPDNSRLRLSRLRLSSVHLLVLLVHFAALSLLYLKTLVKKLGLKVTNHEQNYPLAIAKHSSINDLVSKRMNDNVVTNREFQIINSELENYVELKEDVRSKLKV